MLNPDNNSIYRSCLDSQKGDCPYLHRNEYKVYCCSIGNIVQVVFYGCTPEKVIDKRNKGNENGSKDC